jgi:hypothetical protein
VRTAAALSTSFSRKPLRPNGAVLAVCSLFVLASVVVGFRPTIGTRITRPKTFDSPAEAREFYRLKRAPRGKGPIPVERYFKAIEHVKRMPAYSTRLNRYLKSIEGSKGPVLGQWTNLGPGNVGGRTRALVVNSSNPNVMYAGGVAGGVWKTTNAGMSWSAIADLLPSIAVNSLVIDPSDVNVIYAGTGEGYFNEDSVRGAGIFKSTDAGASWSHLTSTNTPDLYYVNDIVVSPNNNQRIYAGTGTGVWRSTNAGTTWTRVLNTGLVGGCLDLAVRTDQPTDYLLASCGTFDLASVYRNTNAEGAGAWTQVLAELGMGRTSLAIAPSNQAVVYAMASSIEGGPFDHGLYAVFRSTDGGANWTARVRNTDPVKLNTVLLSNPIIAFFIACAGSEIEAFVNQGWYDNVIAVDPLDSNRVWAGGIDLFRSDDGGANWGIASHWWADPSASVYCHADQHAIVFHPGYNGASNKTMYVGNDGGLFVTTDARAATGTGEDAVCNQISNVPWSNLNNNYGVTQFYHGAAYPNGTTYIGGSQDNGVTRGSDGGPNSWSTLLGGDGGYVAVDPTNTDVLYVENILLSIQKSTDAGSTFADAVNGIAESFLDFAFITPFVMDSANPQRLWTGGLFMWRTTDGAANWTQASDIVGGFASFSAIAVAPTNPNNVLAGTLDGFIHRTNIGLTSDENTVWPFAQPRDGFVSSLTFDPADANTAYATYSTFNTIPADRHVYKSTDAGATWAGIDGAGGTGLPDVPVHSLIVDPNSSSRLYVGTDLGVFVSLDGGANWARENTGFANVATESLSINGPAGAKSVFAFTHGRGAWRVPLCAFSVSRFEVFVPESGGAASIDIGAQNGCSWTANTAETWISIVSAESGSGNGSLDLEFRENTTGSPRLGTISVAGHTITVVQDAGLGDDCGFGITPTLQSFPASGGTGSVNVFGEERCAWQASSNSSWISVTSAAVGIGNGVLTYSVAPNVSTSGRKGTITIAGHTFSIKQKGS